MQKKKVIRKKEVKVSEVEMIKAIEVLTNTLKEIRMDGRDALEMAIRKKILDFVEML